MSKSRVPPVRHPAAPHANERAAADTFPCPLPPQPLGLGAIDAELCGNLADAGCPLAPAVQERFRFEALLAELSAAFVNLPAGAVDARIEAALRALVEFLGVDRGGLAELLAGQSQQVVTHSYHGPGVPPLPRIILDDQLPWYAGKIRCGEVLRFARLPDELPAEATAERAYCLAVGLKSHVMVPLAVRDSVVGALGFGAFLRYRDWPDDLVRRLRLVGEIFTNALARKQADEALRAREVTLLQTRARLETLAARLLHAQEEERRRIAREMHDDWTQRLAVLGIDIARLERHLDAPETARPLLHAMQQQLVGLSEDMHALSRQLHPSILDDLGLVEAVRSECASFARREGIAVDYCPEAVPAALPRDVALCVYRVAQEALRNVARHAATAEAWVHLKGDAAELRLCVEDRGAGFDPAAARGQPGLGLSSMEERSRLVRGRLAVVTAPGRGTTVELCVPLNGGAP